MSKIKINHKNNQIIAKTKLGKTEEINQQEMAIFHMKLIRGLMRPTVLGAKKINYTAPDGILLEKYLRRGINKNDFFLVIAQMNEVIKKIEHYGFVLNNLVLDFKYIFINERTREINIIYQPIIGSITNSSIFHFIYEIMSYSVFQNKEDMQSIHELTNYLNRMQFFSTLGLEKYILQVYPEIYKQVHRESFGQSMQLKESVATNIEEEETGRMDMGDDYDREATSLLINENYDLEEQTTLLNMSYEETTVLQQKRMPYLIRTSTQEKIEISKDVFTIGKDPRQVDYAINNNAVSRIHAKIITKNNAFFVQDNQSTNYTYINGKMISPNEEVEISEQSEIMFANESFKFYNNEK